MDKQAFTELNKQAWKADHTLTGRCEVCGKDMWKRDVDYSIYCFGEVFCAKHIPKTTLWGKELILVK